MRSRSDRPITKPTAAQAARLVAVVIQLDDLAEWSMLGPRLEAAKLAVRGDGGITEDELRALEGYRDVWYGLRGDLRAFYRALAPRDETASVALWRVLHGGPPLEGWQEGRLRRLWEEAVGYPPTFEICPRRARKEW